MLDKKFKSIIFDDSYIIGWRHKEEALHIYLDLLLDEDHPLWKPYDRKAFYGCYQFFELCIQFQEYLPAKFSVDNIPIWNEGMGDFETAFDINLFDMTDNFLRIASDDFEISGKVSSYQFSETTISRILQDT